MQGQKIMDLEKEDQRLRKIEKQRIIDLEKETIDINNDENNGNMEKKE